MTRRAAELGAPLVTSLHNPLHAITARYNEPPSRSMSQYLVTSRDISRDLARSRQVDALRALLRLEYATDVPGSRHHSFSSTPIDTPPLSRNPSISRPNKASVTGALPASSLFVLPRGMSLDDLRKWDQDFLSLSSQELMQLAAMVFRDRHTRRRPNARATPPRR